MSLRHLRILLCFSAALLLFGITGCHKSVPTTQSQNLSLLVPEIPASAKSCKSINGLPDSTCTPGVARTTDVNEICHGGGTKLIRPSVSYTNALKKQGIAAYGYADTNMQNYEEDHLISLELGGDGSDPKNLWPQPHEGKYNSYLKDQVENWLHKQICTYAMTPKEAQEGIAKDRRQYITDLVKTSETEVQ